MTLLKQWQDLIGNQTDATFEEFWDKYSSTETRIYEDILKDKSGKSTGKFSELAEKYEADPIIFMGFLDGISTSVNNELDLENVTADSEISLDIDFEKLYFNMHKAGADYLFNLPQWDDIYSEEKREEIYDAYRKSRTVVKEKAPGRNDPCPCGSGKKYKKCCGAAV